MKTFFLTTLLTSLLIFSASTQAQQDPIDPSHPSHLVETGKMFTIKIVPADKRTQIFVLGKEAVRLDLGKYKMKATLFSSTGAKELSLKRNDDHFVTDSSLAQGETLSVELKSNDDPKVSETLKLKLNKP